MREKRTSVTTTALLAAHERLSAGQASVTDGRVSIANVAREAGASRATAYRCVELVEMFDTAAKPARSKSSTSSNQRDLRDAIERLLNRITLLEAMLQAKDVEIDKLRLMLPNLSRPPLTG